MIEDSFMLKEVDREEDERVAARENLEKLCRSALNDHEKSKQDCTPLRNEITEVLNWLKKNRDAEKCLHSEGEGLTRNTAQ